MQGLSTTLNQNKPKLISFQFLFSLFVLLAFASSFSPIPFCVSLNVEEVFPFRDTFMHPTIRPSVFPSPFQRVKKSTFLSNLLDSNRKSNHNYRYNTFSKQGFVTNQRLPISRFLGGLLPSQHCKDLSSSSFSYLLMKPGLSFSASSTNSGKSLSSPLSSNTVKSFSTCLSSSRNPLAFNGGKHDNDHNGINNNKNIHFYSNRMGASSTFQSATHLYAANPLVTNSLAEEKRLPGFLDSLLCKDDTQYLLYVRGKPLIQITSDTGLNIPHWLSNSDLMEMMAFIYDSPDPTTIDLSATNMPLMVVLGEADNNENNKNEGIDGENNGEQVKEDEEIVIDDSINKVSSSGNNWRIAIDITKYESKVQQYFHIDDFSSDPSHLDKREEVFYTFGNIRALMGILPPSDIAILGQGFALISFHSQHMFCSKCGSPTVSSEGGTRRKCSNVENCNYKAYPRIDPVCIVLVYDPKTDRILLGRSKGYRPGMFSCLAGFLELCESLEEGVKREVFEESGIKLGKMRYHSSQPWPIGRGASCQIMLGFLAEATTEEINMDQHELEACRWFTRAEVTAAKEIKVAGTATTQGAHNNDKNQNEEDDANTLRVPGPYAIAHHLIKDWLDNVSPHSNL